MLRIMQLERKEGLRSDTSLCVIAFSFTVRPATLTVITCTNVHINTCVYVQTHIHAHIHIYMRNYVCGLYAYILMYVYIYIYTYMYVDKNEK